MCQTSQQSMQLRPVSTRGWHQAASSPFPSNYMLIRTNIGPPGEPLYQQINN